MWKKIKIFTTKISKYNNGFILNKSLNKLIHLYQNYSTSLPFKLFYINGLYDYELLFSNKLLSIYFLINLSKIKFLINSGARIPYKNELFKILKYNNTQKKVNTIYFQKLNITSIINNYDIISYNFNNNIIFEDTLFSMKEETIKIMDKPYLNRLIVDIFFCFVTTIDIMPFINNKKICIIDFSSKYNTTYNIINLDNYTKITSDFFKNDLIIIDINLFLSTKYTSSYKLYHNDHLSYYSFINYKNSLDSISKLYNIELFDNFNIILVNMPLNKLSNHPIRFSKSKKIFMYDYINTNLINNITDMVSTYYNIKYNNSINCNKILKHVLYITPNKYNVYSILLNTSSINIKNCNIDINIKYDFITKPITDICSINYTIIKNNTHVSFNCGHKFIIEDLYNFCNQYKKCPYCRIHISLLTLNLNKNTLIYDLLGSQFNNLYYYYENHYIINYTNISIIDLIKEHISNIYFINNLNNLNNLPISPKSVLYFNNINDKLEILNYISDKINTKNISKIVTLSFY